MFYSFCHNKHALWILSCNLNLEDVQVVQEFLAVFPKDLLGLLPDREIKFIIDLCPRIALILKAPYRMASIELKQLNVQLEELLDKKFIRPSF